MPRLPQPGADQGAWGEILNEFLGEAHQSDGSLKDIPQSKVTGLVNELTSKVEVSQKGAPQGVASLDEDGRIPDAQLPARLSDEGLTSSVAAQITDADLATARKAGVFIPSPTAAIRWHQLRTATLAGQRQTHIGWLGDSIGYGAANTGATQPKPGKIIPGLLRSSLARKFGSAGGGWTLLDTVRLFGNVADDPRFSKTAGVTAQGFGPFVSGAWRVQALDGSEYIEFTDTCSEFLITVLGGGYQMRVTIDGGAPITLLNSTSNSTPSDIAPETGYYQNNSVGSHKVFKIPAGATGSHTLRVWPITSGSLFLVSVEGRIPTVGTFRVGNMSVNGKSLSSFLTYTGEGATGNEYLYSGDLWLDTFKPDLLMIALGINDWQGQVPLATTKSRLIRLIDRQRATGANAYGSTKNGGDAVLVWHPIPDTASLGGGAYTNPSWSAYRDLFYEVAREKNVCLIDLGEQWGETFADANARGLYADTIHPSDNGYLDIAARIENALFNII